MFVASDMQPEAKVTPSAMTTAMPFGSANYCRLFGWEARRSPSLPVAGKVANVRIAAFVQGRFCELSPAPTLAVDNNFLRLRDGELLNSRAQLIVGNVGRPWEMPACVFLGRANVKDEGR